MTSQADDTATAEEVVPVQQVIMPVTGEVLALTEPTDQLAAAIDEVAILQTQLAAAKRLIADELLERMDHEGVWTVHVPGFTVKGNGPGAVDYDGEELARRLRRLVKAGVISQGAMTNAVERVPVWKPKKAGINALLKLGGAITEAVEACGTPSTKPRNVSVTPTGGDRNGTAAS